MPSGLFWSIPNIIWMSRDTITPLSWVRFRSHHSPASFRQDLTPSAGMLSGPFSSAVLVPGVPGYQLSPLLDPGSLLCYPYSPGLADTASQILGWGLSCCCCCLGLRRQQKQPCLGPSLPTSGQDRSCREEDGQTTGRGHDCELELLLSVTSIGEWSRSDVVQ